MGRETGPNSHWLSRLPASLKSWRFREGAVRYLAEVLRFWEHRYSLLPPRGRRLNLPQP